MDNKHITLAPSDQLEGHQETLAKLAEILELDLAASFISDESRLSDFSSCGLPETYPEFHSLDALYAAWDEWIKAAIFEAFGVQLITTRVLLVELCERIESTAKPTQLDDEGLRRHDVSGDRAAEHRSDILPEREQHVRLDVPPEIGEVRELGGIMNVDGIITPQGVRLIGAATRVPGRDLFDACNYYHCLGDVGGALCVLEIAVRATDASSQADQPVI